ncbi:MAG: transcription elongation factor GreA [Lachnospiraceae bacterium]|nr:transcription elongation factor GreA [Lachnospiraceae bacterium]
MHDKLTREDIKKMEEEILHRKLVVRKECLEAVKEARAQGDLSENFEYYAAKKEKNRNESRIRYLERMIRTAQVIEDKMQEDEVGLNKEVEVYFEEDDETEIFKMVTTIRVDTMKGYISMESPIGKAIFGKKTGERVFVRINDNLGYYVQIKSVKPLAEEDKGNLLEY